MRIIIIDNNHLIISQLEELSILNDIDVTAIGFSGFEAINLYKKYKPDMILLDTNLPDMSGLNVSEVIFNFDKSAKIILMTSLYEDEYLLKYLCIGCRAYIKKDNIKGIIPVINAVSSGNIVIDQSILKDFYLNNKTLPKTDISFSERESEIIFLVSEGYNNKEIAKKLFLSEGTVRNYVSIVLEKLNLRDRTQLVVWYYKNK